MKKLNSGIKIGTLIIVFGILVAYVIPFNDSGVSVFRSYEICTTPVPLNDIPAEVGREGIKWKNWCWAYPYALITSYVIMGIGILVIILRIKHNSKLN